MEAALRVKPEGASQWKELWKVTENTKAQRLGMLLKQETRVSLTW